MSAHFFHVGMFDLFNAVLVNVGQARCDESNDKRAVHIVQHQETNDNWA